jgi:bla regulator protein blaR1
MMTMPDALLRALGWALTHSLWQAAVTALALLILLPRLQTARQRYWAAYGALMAVLAAAAGTFIWMYEQVSASGAGVQVNYLENIFFFGSNQYLSTSLVESFSHWLELNHTLVVAIWLIGFMFFLLRLGPGFWQVHRLRTRGVNTVEAIWQEKIRTLSEEIEVSRSVQLFESAWVHAPLTMGWLKPAILLHIGFVNNLSFAEVEAVLAHELAHIARRDWIFNLVQAFVESIFYYHPAVWWISQVVRRERENACDDVALAATGNPLAFARALVQVQEMPAPVPALALALSGKRRRPLLERVRRILNQAPQQQHQVMEKL